MPNVKSILNDIEKLPLHQKEQILSTLEEILVLGSQVSQVEQEVKEFRFSKGKVCPICGSETISRNGKHNGKQRYICKSCKKSFTDFTNSATYKSKKTLDKWFKWLQIFGTDKEIIKAKNFIVQSNVTHSYIKIKDFKNREPMHVLYFVNYVIISIVKNYSLINDSNLLRSA